MQKKIVIPRQTGSGKKLYRPQHIICCQADREYTVLFVLDDCKRGWKPVEGITHHLGLFEGWLRDFGFQRVSKSIMVNLDYVDGWLNEDKSTYILLEYDCFSKIKLGDQWREEFFSRLTINFINQSAPVLKAV